MGPSREFFQEVSHHFAVLQELLLLDSSSTTETSQIKHVPMTFYDPTSDYLECALAWLFSCTEMMLQLVRPNFIMFPWYRDIPSKSKHWNEIRRDKLFRRCLPQITHSIKLGCSNFQGNLIKKVLEGFRTRGHFALPYPSVPFPFHPP